MGAGDQLRIGYVWARPLPSRETDTQQVMKTVHGMAEAGAAVDLIIPNTGRARALPRDAFERELREFYGLGDAPFGIVTRPGVPSSRLELERAVHPLAATLAPSGARYDVLYSRSRSVTLLCALRGLPVVWETYRMFGHEQPRLIATLARLARRPTLLGIVTHSDVARDSIVSAGFPPERIATVHNGFAPDEMEPRLSRRQARDQLGLRPDQALCCYTGHVRARKGMGAVLELAARAPEVRFALVGGNPQDVEALQQTCAQRGIDNVECLGWKPAAELPPWLYAADVLLIPPAAAPLREHGRTVLPMKLFTYLAAGRPILAPALPDLQELLTDEDNALLVPPDDPDAAASALRRILADGALASRLATRARERSSGLTWQARAARIVEQIQHWRAQGPALRSPRRAG
jgi:glycosyltransferase involved in cell wall biosynthesis